MALVNMALVHLCIRDRVEDGVAYIGSSDGQRLSAFAASDGRLQWYFDTGGSSWAKPAAAGNAVFTGAVGVANYIVDHQAACFVIDKVTGEGIREYSQEQPGDPEIWGFASSLAVGKKHVFVGALDGSIYAFELEPDTR